MNAARRILVVDGDPDWRGRIADALATPAHEVTALGAGLEALAFARREKPHLVVTEVLLPDVTGLGLCRTLREDPALEQLGLLVVTSLASEIDRVLVFETGADDLLPKPFFARELLSRATAVLRRSNPSRESAGALAIEGPAVSIAADSGSVVARGERIDLTPRELQIFAALMRESGRVLSRGQLIQLVWGDASRQAERVVDAHVKAIRRKLGDAGACVETVRGVGYRYAERPPAATA
jgi:DNA-binding response OmpR family regulator